jgi:serine/threonine-protein kinase
MALKLREGDLLLDRYRIERVLGEGGMGVVVAARREGSGERVAIKYLNKEASRDSTVSQRFEREGRATARLRSRHTPQILETGKADGSFFLVMEHLDGRDIAHALESGERLPIARVVDVVLQACDVMAEAHALGIVHRDLKPANLFLADVPGKDPILKVLDFGISKNLSPNTMSGGLTKTNDVFGSPLYMSPEQLISSGKVDSRTDIWALGVILYELLTGTTPFASPSLTELWSAVMLEQPAPPSTHRPDVPAGLEAVILRCLEKDPNARFRTVADFAEALAPFGSDASMDCVQRARAFQPMDAPDPPSSIHRSGMLPPRSEPRPTLQLDDTASIARSAGAPTARKPITSSMLPPYLATRRAKSALPFALALALALVCAAFYVLFGR